MSSPNEKEFSVKLLNTVILDDGIESGNDIKEEVSSICSKETTSLGRQEIIEDSPGEEDFGDRECSEISPRIEGLEDDVPRFQAGTANDYLMRQQTNLVI